MILDTLLPRALVILLRFQGLMVTVLLPLPNLKPHYGPRSTKAPRCTAMANFLFPCITLLIKLALLVSASLSRDVMVETDTLPLLVQLVKYFRTLELRLGSPFPVRTQKTYLAPSSSIHLKHISRGSQESGSQSWFGKT